MKFMRQKEGLDPPRAWLFVSIIAIWDLESIFASFTELNVKLR